MSIGFVSSCLASCCLRFTVPVGRRRRSRCTRRLDAFSSSSSEARARGALVLVGRCWEAGGAPAYWPWVQSLRSYVRACDSTALRAELGAGAGDVAHLVPELRQQFPDLPEPASLDSEGSRFRL